MLSPSTALHLQRHVGNRAVTTALAGTPVVSRVPVVPFRPVADFDTMTLGDLHSYARSRPDWDMDPALTPARKKKLDNVLEFARAGDPQPVGPCDRIPVKDLEANGLSPVDRGKLRNYSRAVLSKDSAGTTQKSVLGEAIKDGETLGKLEAAIPKAVLHHQLGLNEDGKGSFEALVAAGKATDFGRYFAAARPNLDADNGADVDSYLKMAVDEDHRDPTGFVGKLPHVKNYHRFHADLLDKLVANERVFNRAKPLLLILHSGLDHNGAFHRDVGLRDLVKHPRNLTIMVEGATTLEGLGSEAQRIAKRQGKNKRIQQLMLAGHGQMQDMELAGTPGKSEGQGLDLADKNRARTEKFLKGLIGNMDTGPDARIVLNACLTAADPIAENLPADPGDARKAIKEQLDKSPNLMNQIKSMAPGRTVEGNVSSVGAGTYMAVDAHGVPTGELHGEVPDDPRATQSDRGMYIEEGTEPEGCMRALTAHWALDEADALKHMEERRKKPIGDWHDRVIHTFYDMVHDEPQNAAMMSRLANLAARGLSDMNLVAEQTPRNIGAMVNLTEAEMNRVFTALHPHADPGAKLAIDQVWMFKIASRRNPPASFMTVLDTFATIRLAQPHLSLGGLSPSLAALLPIASATAPSTAQMKLAIFARSKPEGKAFLVANAAGTGKLSPPAGHTVESLSGGTATESGVLEELGLLAAAGAAPNMDLDGDGVADIFVESLTRRSMVTASWLNIRERPDETSSRFESMPAGARVLVIGQTGDWYCVEVKKRVGFAAKKFLRDLKVA